MSRSERALRRIRLTGVARLALLALAATLACNDEVVLEAAVGLSYNCQRPEGVMITQASSIRVEVIEWYSGAPGDVRDSECFDDLDLEIDRPIDLIDWFDERGYVARRIPTDVPTRVQLVAFGEPGCEVVGGQADICAISQDTLSETGFSEGDTTRFSFSCRPQSGDLTGTLATCLGFGEQPAE
jgi:hypothetical protein